MWSWLNKSGVGFLDGLSLESLRFKAFSDADSDFYLGEPGWIFENLRRTGA